MKFFSTQHEFPYTWQHVSAAHWQKYPNPSAKHVVHVDVIDQSVHPETGVLRTERILACRQGMPTLLRKMLGGDDISYAYEVHEIDPKTQTHTIKSVNLTYANLMRVEETCTYQPAQDKTIFLQEAKIAAFGAISRFAHYVEDFSVKRFCENATVGRMGFEKVLESVEGNGLNVL